MTETLPIPHKDAGHPDAYWRTMRLFSLYRLTIASILFVTYFMMREETWWRRYDDTLYFATALLYVCLGAVAAVMAWWRWPRFNRQLTLQIMGDIVCIVVLMHAGGGVKSGLGLLMVVAVAGASLISQGRLALFYAALASIAVLLEQSWRVLLWQGNVDDYSHAVLLGLSFFATAWLAHTFARRTRQSEELASRRGIDLQNMSQVNQLVIRDMQDGVIVVDGASRIRLHNSRAEALLGTHPQGWEDAALTQVAPELAQHYAAWLAGVEEGAREGWQLAKSGRELRLRFMPVSQERDQGAVIFIEDWSRVQAQARQLKLAALGRLTANIAHEIRNPLSSISHASQLLQEEDALAATPRRLLQIIDDNVRRLDQMVQDVMQLSRRDRVRQEIIPLFDYLQEFCAQFCQVEKIAPAGIVLQPLRQPVSVMFDRNHLHQVLWNLCRNGWRHGRRQAGSLQLRIGGGGRASEVSIEVMDDGPGVSQEAKRHLFEPFYTTEASGTGLGLYVARELCEANGAGLNYVESSAGGRFVIFIRGVQ